LTTSALDGEIDTECQIAKHATALGFETRAGAGAVAADLALFAFCVVGAAPGLPANAAATMIRVAARSIPAADLVVGTAGAYPLDAVFTGGGVTFCVGAAVLGWVVTNADIWARTAKQTLTVASIVGFTLVGLLIADSTDAIGAVVE
jgi:hypothetical protein